MTNKEIKIGAYYYCHNNSLTRSLVLGIFTDCDITYVRARYLGSAYPYVVTLEDFKKRHKI